MRPRVPATPTEATLEHLSTPALPWDPQTFPGLLGVRALHQDIDHTGKPSLRERERMPLHLAFPHFHKIMIALTWTWIHLDPPVMGGGHLLG